MEKKHYFMLKSLVVKYGKDSIIAVVNKIVNYNANEKE